MYRSRSCGELFIDDMGGYEAGAGVLYAFPDALIVYLLRCRLHILQATIRLRNNLSHLDAPRFRSPFFH